MSSSVKVLLMNISIDLHKCKNEAYEGIYPCNILVMMMRKDVGALWVWQGCSIHNS